MNRADLAARIRALGIPEDAVALDGATADEAYVLDGAGSDWSVYYSERGLRSGERRFASESEACEYLLQVLMRDFGRE